MTEAVLNFTLNSESKQHNFKLDKGFKDALGDYLNRRWPKSTAKEACKAFRGLSLDQAKKAAAYDGSLTTLELIIKRGGPSVFLPIMEEVWGQSIARHLIELRASYESNGERLAALVGGRGSVPASRRPDPPDSPDALVDGEGASRRRVGSR